MARHLRVLLWKEWREGWAVMVPLWVAAPLVGAWVRAGAEGERLPREYMGSLLGVAFLCFAAALVGGRLFAGEGETGTARFLLRQPVSRAMVWGAKLLAGGVFLAALYAAWLPARGGEGQWLIWLPLGSRTEYVGYWANPQATWWPLVAFGAAVLLSTVVDNAVLAFVGGMVAWAPFAAMVNLSCQIAGSRIAAPRADAVYLGTTALIAVLAAAAGLLAMSYAAFQWRKGR